MIFFFAAPGPVVTGLSPSNMPFVGGTVVTILGANFWGVDPTPTAWIGAPRCQKTTWISPNSVECLASAHTELMYGVIVMAHRRWGEMAPGFAIDGENFCLTRLSRSLSPKCPPKKLL